MPLEMLPSDRRLKYLVLRKYYALPFRGDGPTKVPGRRRTADAIHRVDWSLIVILGNLAKLTPNQPQAAHEAHGCVLTGVRGGGASWALRISNPIQRVYELNSQSPASKGVKWPSDHLAAFSQSLDIGSLIWNVFGLSNQVVASPQRTHGFLWMAADLEVGNRTIMRC